MANYEGEDEVQFETQPEDSDFAEEHGDLVAYVVQKLLHNQKIPNTTQRHQIFYSWYSVKDKICNLIIDNERCENIVSKTLVDHLKLETTPHHHLYNIEQIKKGPSIKVTDLCHVLISIGEHYQHSVACDVVNMNKYHILLGRQLQHNVDATHKGKENIYVFTKRERVSMRQIPPLPKSICKKRRLDSYPYAIKLFRTRGRVLLKRGTDVGTHSQKLRLNQGPGSSLDRRPGPSRNPTKDINRPPGRPIKDRAESERSQSPDQQDDRPSRRQESNREFGSSIDRPPNRPIQQF